MVLLKAKNCISKTYLKAFEDINKTVYSGFCSMAQFSLNRGCKQVLKHFCILYLNDI